MLKSSIQEQELEAQVQDGAARIWTTGSVMWLQKKQGESWAALEAWCRSQKALGIHRGSVLRIPAGVT